MDKMIFLTALFAGQFAFADFDTKCQAVIQDIKLVNSLFDWQVTEKGAAFIVGTDHSYNIFNVAVSENNAGEYLNVRALRLDESLPKESDLTAADGSKTYLFRVQNNRYGIEISAISGLKEGQTQPDFLARNVEYGKGARKTVSLFSGSRVGLRCTKLN